MRIDGKDFSLKTVTEGLGLGVPKDPKRSIRMEKKAGGLVEVDPWSKAKGHDWNPLKGYFDKKRFVKALEKDIDKVLGAGEGKKLTKQVGAYNRTFFSGSLPKMNVKQTEELERIVATRRMTPTVPERFEERIDEAGGKFWNGTVEINDLSTTELLNDLKNTFKQRFAEKFESFHPQFLKDNPRSIITLSNDNETKVLKGLEGDELERALTRVVPDAQTRRNLTAMLVQDAIGSLDVVFSLQEALSLQDPNENNSLICKVTMENDNIFIAYENNRSLNQLTFVKLEGPQSIPLDKDHSYSTSSLTISISAADVGQGKVDSLRIVGTASVSVELYPGTPGADSPPPAPSPEV